MSKSVIHCHEIGDFDRQDLSDVREAFATALTFDLGQAWLERPEEGLAEGKVKLGWRDDLFLVLAELEDVQPTTKAEWNNENLWQLGDTFEMFVAEAGGEPYFEFHISPNARHLQLEFPSSAEFQKLRPGDSLDEFLVTEPLFTYEVWTGPSKWTVLAEIPSSIFVPEGPLLRSRMWEVSFSRYDYLPGVDEPVLSSTSPHAVAKFHRREEWRPVRFVGG